MQLGFTARGSMTAAQRGIVRMILVAGGGGRLHLDGDCPAVDQVVEDALRIGGYALVGSSPRCAERLTDPLHIAANADVLLVAPMTFVEVTPHRARHWNVLRRARDLGRRLLFIYSDASVTTEHRGVHLELSNGSNGQALDAFFGRLGFDLRSLLPTLGTDLPLGERTLSGLERQTLCRVLGDLLSGAVLDRWGALRQVLETVAPEDLEVLRAICTDCEGR